MDFKKTLFLFIMGIFTLSPFSMIAQEKFKWGILEKTLQKENRENPTKWDKDNFLNDSISFYRKKRGYFPDPQYDFIAKDSFNGLGYGMDNKGEIINGKRFIYSYFYINKCLINNEYIGNMDNEVFFSIVTLTDLIDSSGFSHMGADITSRNHPNYLSEGFFKYKFNRVDYSAFITGDRQSYAIVNSRIFDLNIGRLILIIPQKNHSLKSIQMTIPIVSTQEIKTQILEILNSLSVQKLVSESGTIISN